MIRKKEELLDAIKGVVGESATDEVLSLIEDVSDTFTDLEEKTKDQTDYKKQLEENDQMWRKKYHDRFFNTTDDKDPIDPPDDKPPVRRYEDLFK